jgi:hypothetical protein
LDPVAFQVVIITENHSIAGELGFHDQRLSDYLNDRRETAISLRNVSVARLDEPSKVIQKLATAVVLKSMAVVAFEPPQAAIPATQRFFGYVKKEKYDVFLITDGMEIRGTLHTQGQLDLRRFVVSTTDSFLPITGAKITLLSNHRYLIDQPAIMVNANRIHYIGKI